MKLIKGNIENLTGDVLIYSIYKEIFSLPEFNSLWINNIPEKYKDGTAFGIYFTLCIDNLEDKLPSFSRDDPDSMKSLIEYPISSLSKKLMGYGKELTGYSKLFHFPSESELLEHLEGVNEIFSPEVYSRVSLCLMQNSIKLDDYIIRFIYQQNKYPTINVQNKSYGQASPEEIGKIVTGYFDNMNKALIRGDKSEFIDIERKLLNFAAECPLISYISETCDLLLKANEKQRIEISDCMSSIIEKTKSEEYEIAKESNKKLIKLKNSLDKKINI